MRSKWDTHPQRWWTEKQVMMNQLDVVVVDKVDKEAIVTDGGLPKHQHREEERICRMKLEKIWGGGSTWLTPPQKRWKRS